jgi:hypothetical protein
MFFFLRGFSWDLKGNILEKSLAKNYLSPTLVHTLFLEQVIPWSRGCYFQWAFESQCPLKISPSCPRDHLLKCWYPLSNDWPHLKSAPYGQTATFWSNSLFGCKKYTYFFPAGPHRSTKIFCRFTLTDNLFWISFSDGHTGDLGQR